MSNREIFVLFALRGVPEESTKKTKKSKNTIVKKKSSFQNY